ncbi:hypothetical protein EVJ58_g3229 [Rhodofomes roseus]|uniref:Uncharacterized protein n=1 Tax=Rhodofomes roseus TaxID=34475 RepID=A0A4Y9YNW0_9APHY|nr:hypothetical protein EVJ58_g3229 [Rhodofomes roseus]
MKLLWIPIYKLFYKGRIDDAKLFFSREFMDTENYELYDGGELMFARLPGDVLVYHPEGPFDSIYYSRQLEDTHTITANLMTLTIFGEISGNETENFRLVALDSDTFWKILSGFREHDLERQEIMRLAKDQTKTLQFKHRQERTRARQHSRAAFLLGQAGHMMLRASVAVSLGAIGGCAAIAAIRRAARCGVL